MGRRREGSLSSAPSEVKKINARREGGTGVAMPITPAGLPDLQLKTACREGFLNKKLHAPICSNVSSPLNPGNGRAIIGKSKHIMLEPERESGY